MPLLAPLSRLAALGRRARLVAAQRGLGHAVRAGFRDLLGRITGSLAYYQVRHGRRRFAFHGRRYAYFLHRYNSTWKTERTVEVPIFRQLLQDRAGARILEIGNVLAHYGPIQHRVVDKYERAPHVQNIDVVDIDPASRYDLIVSISTLEHVGWDDPPRNPEKVIRAIEHLRGLLAPGGQLVASLPMAYNPHLDDYLRNGRIAPERIGCLQRISADNRWKEVNWPTIAHAGFNHPFRGINGLVIAYWQA